MTSAPPGSPDAGRALVRGAVVDHVGLTVPNLEAAIAFFVRVLGAEVMSHDGPLVGPDNDMAPRPVLVAVAMLRLGPCALIELLQFDTGSAADEAAGPTLSRPTATVAAAGGHHIAIEVADLDAAVGALRLEPGVAVPGATRTIPPGRTRAGSRFVYVRTPWGLALELIEFPQAAATSGAAAVAPPANSSWQ